VSLTPAGAYDWENLLSDARWLHVTGITPAISSVAADAALAAVVAAKKAGVTVSSDLNYRKKLWRWEGGTEPRQLAGRVMRELLPYVDVLIGNEGDAEDVLGIRAGGSDVESGRLDIDRYPEVARKIAYEFPNIEKIAITLRESISADDNRWGAMLYDVPAARAVFAPTRDGRYVPWEIRDIIDRVGGGDSFGAGLIRGLAGDEFTDDADILAFAVASSCLAHSIDGDYNLTTFDEAHNLMGGTGSGRVVR
jgi:2-dehydro-3-deoxygluconokinase